MRRAVCIALLVSAVFLAGCFQPQPPAEEPSLELPDAEQPGKTGTEAGIKALQNCLSLTGSARDNCVRLVAIQEDSSSLCDSISKASWPFCVMDVAIENQNPVHCSVFTQANLKNACYKTLALIKAEALYCNQMVVEDEHSKLSKDDCLRGVAKKTFDPTLCEGMTPGGELEGVKLQDDCYYWVALGNYDGEFCEEVVDAKIKADCVEDVLLAIEHKEKTDACKALEGEEAQTNCLNELG